MILKCIAPAKINLYLDVLAKRACDGYHEIESVMQSVSLCDNITISINKSNDFSLSVSCSDKNVPSNEKNLAYRAAASYFSLIDTSNRNYDVNIYIEKKIPAQAGLGGGSSDAAAVLNLLNSFFDNRFDTDELCKIGASLGADIPFCIVGNTAVTRGIGDIITPISCKSELNFVVAIGKDRVSTPDAFRLLDDKFGINPDSFGKIQNIVSALEQGQIEKIRNSLYNKFEYVIIPKCESVSKIKALMIDFGAEASLMSGSGSSVFGIFSSYNDALSAEKKLSNLGLLSFSCKSIL